MVLTDLDRSMCKVFKLSQLVSELDSKLGVIAIYNQEVQAILDRIKSLYSEENDSPPS